MEIVHGDAVFQVDPGSPPNYSSGNPFVKLVSLLETVDLAASRGAYLPDSLQYLLPFDHLTLYGPSPPDQGVLAPEQQDNKTDFQKQNVKEFVMADCILVRGLASAGDWTGPFLRLSYRGGPDTALSVASGHSLGPAIRLWLRVGGTQVSQPIVVPYNLRTDRYDIELWGFAGGELRPILDDRARDAFDRGELVARPDLVHADLTAFDRDGKDGRYMVEVDPTSTYHPVLPLHLEVAWSDAAGAVWDSNNGANYHYEFNMVVRGWDHYLGTGISPNPHGGIGFLEYRNLISNYGRYAGSNELLRRLESWNFDAHGNKGPAGRVESFMAVDYMDLHVLRKSCGIGLHRHRDNQEVFFMAAGRALMCVGDWCKLPNRERSFEIRTLRAGHLALLKGGNLHGLMNTTDENISLFMFGGYD